MHVDLTINALKMKPYACFSIKKKNPYATLMPLPNIFVTLTSNLVAMPWESVELKSLRTEF